MAVAKPRARAKARRGGGGEAPPAKERHLSEPWFSLVATGVKRCEGRTAASRASFTPGEAVRWFNDDLGFRRVADTRVTEVREYPGFEAMLAARGAELLPTVETVADGLSVYRRFYKSIGTSREPAALCVGLELLPPARGQLRGDLGGQ